MDEFPFQPGLLLLAVFNILQGLLNQLCANAFFPFVKNGSGCLDEGLMLFGCQTGDLHPMNGNFL